MEYVAEAVQEEGMRFEVTMGQHGMVSDYPMDPSASGSGPRPLEMLLGSLAACAGGTLVALLQGRKQPLSGLRVLAHGQRRTEHPTAFTEISLEFVVSGPVEPSVVARAIEYAEAHVCPVWAMLKPSTPITSSFRVEP
jgi:putative redox protein